MPRWGRVGSLLVSVGLTASSLLLSAAPADALPIESVTVPASAPDGASSTTVLTAGTTYILEARGTFSYGFQGGQADAECTTLPPDPTWQPFRYFFLAPDSDFLDLLVNGENVMWQPSTPDVFGCNSANHRYRLTFTPAASGAVNFRVLDTGYTDNGGALIVDIHEAAETLVQTLTVPTTLSGGVYSAPLSSSKFYRIQASGTGTYDQPTFNQLDAECTTFMPDPTWQTNRWLLLDLQGDVGDLYVNGQNMSWRPETADLFGCNSTDHVYDVDFRPTASGPVNFAVEDTFHGDNTGALEVKIFELAFNPTEGPELLNPPTISLAEQLEVNSADPDGTTSAIPFPAGQQILIEVSGGYTYWPPRTADARCSNTTSDPTHVPSEENFPSPLLQLVVNEQAVMWTPTTPDGGEPECNSTDHQYRLIYVPSQTGLLNFRIPDLNHADNSGILTVRIFRIREIPAGMVSVNSMNPAGTPTPPLLAGRTYRLRASGTYGYWQGVAGTSADAECAEAAPFGNPPFARNQFGSGDTDWLDVFVNDLNVEWLTSAGSSIGCDPDHLFDHTLTAAGNGPINLKVKDFNYGDNSGSVQVQLFLQVN